VINEVAPRSLPIASLTSLTVIERSSRRSDEYCIPSFDTVFPIEPPQSTDSRSSLFSFRFFASVSSSALPTVSLPRPPATPLLSSPKFGNSVRFSFRRLIGCWSITTKSGGRCTQQTIALRHTTKLVRQHGLKFPSPRQRERKFWYQ
jgi:hypothetical protein